MASKKIEFVLDVDGKPIDIAVDKTLNLKQQFRELTKELNKTKEGTKEFELLSAKIADTKDEMDKTNAKSKDLFGSLSLLPGPVGAFAGSVDNAIGTLKTFTSFSFKDLKFQLGETLKDFKDIASSVGKATGITKIYTTLNNALAKSFVAVGVGEEAAALGAKAFAGALVATGVGAVVVALGFLIEKIMDLVSGEKEAKEAADALNSTLDQQKNIADITAAAVTRRNKERLAQMKSQGATEQELRDEQLRQAQAALTTAQKNEEQARANYNQFYAKAAAAEKTRLAKDLDAKKELTKNADSDLKVLQFDNLTAINNERDKKNKESEQKNKDHLKRLEEDTKRGLEKLRELESNNRIQAIKDERAREDQQMVEDKKKEEAEINALQLKDTKIDGVVVTAKELREKLLAQVSEKYRIKGVQTKDKRDKEDEDKEKQLQEKIQAIREAGEQATLDLMKEGASKQIAQIERDGKNKIDKYTQQVNELVTLGKKSRAEADAMISGYTENIKQAVANATTEITNTDWLNKFDANLNEFFSKLDNSYKNVKSKIEESKDDLDKKLKAGAITQQQYTERTLALEDQLYKARQRNIQAIDMLAQAAGTAAQAFGEQSKAGKTLIKIQQGLALASTGLALAYALEGLGKDLKKGFPTNLIAVASTLILMGTAFAQFKQLTGKQPKELGKDVSSTDMGSQAAPTPQANLGQNYATGGMIGGRRHAQGGTMIEAEAGEAIMTRGAVTMFAPLLSMMNQMGGGTSFARSAVSTSYDNPKSDNPAAAASPIIVKSYVVSNEMTSSQEKQARLKDLSTL